MARTKQISRKVPGEPARKRLIADKKDPVSYDDGDDDDNDDDQDKKEPPSDKKRQATPVKRKAPPVQLVYVLIYAEGGPYREEFDPEVVGVYSSKQLAVDNSKRAFEARTNFYENGSFTEPQIFDETKDNTSTIGEEGRILLYQKDREGDWSKLSIEVKQLDQPVPQATRMTTARARALFHSRCKRKHCCHK